MLLGYADDFRCIFRHYCVRFDTWDVSMPIRHVRAAWNAVHLMRDAFRGSNAQVCVCALSTAYTSRSSAVLHAKRVRPPPSSTHSPGPSTHPHGCFEHPRLLHGLNANSSLPVILAVFHHRLGPPTQSTQLRVRPTCSGVRGLNFTACNDRHLPRQRLLPRSHSSCSLSTGSP